MEELAGWLLSLSVAAGDDSIEHGPFGWDVADAGISQVEFGFGGPHDAQRRTRRPMRCVAPRRPTARLLPRAFSPTVCRAASVPGEPRPRPADRDVGNGSRLFLLWPTGPTRLADASVATPPTR